MGRVSPSVVLQRIGLVGDVHTESLALERSLAFLKESEVDLLLCVGDVVDGPEDVYGANRCCELLQEHDVQTVCGNHDRWLLEGVMRDLPDALDAVELERESIRYLESLPPTRTFATPAGTLLLCHGLGCDDMAALAPLSDDTTDEQGRAALRELLEDGGYRFVVNGHSHRRAVREINGTLFVNVGTLHREHDQTVGVIDFRTQEIIFYGIAEGREPWVLERIAFAARPPQLTAKGA